MNDTILLWILGTFVLCLGAISGLLWRHVEHCKEVHSKLAEIGADVKRIQSDIGTHETGIRGTVHKTANTVLVLDGRVSLLEQSQRWGGQR